MKPKFLAKVFDSLVPPSGGTRFASLDGLRALAALAVAFNHLPTWQPHYVFAHYGGAAVNIFFCLSAFLLYYPHVVGKAPDARTYYWRRAWRIYPAYLVALLVGALVTVVIGKPVLLRDFGSHLFFAHSWSLTTLKTLIDPAWSLAGEAQFYLLLPLLALIIKPKQPWSLVGAIAAVALLQLPFQGSMYRLAVVDQETLPTTNWPFLALPFFCGMQAAWLVANKPYCCKYLAPVGLIGLALCGSLPAAFFPRQESWLCYLFFYPRTLGVSLCSLAAIAGLAGSAGFCTKLLAWKPLRAVGISGFGLFLFHSPIYLLLGQFVPASRVPYLGLPLAIIVGILSYLYIEAPAMRLGRSWTGLQLGWLRRRLPEPRPID